MKKIKSILIICSLLIIGVLSGCMGIGDSSQEESFFCGAVCVTLEKRGPPNNDRLVITFYKTGNYSFKFVPDRFDCCCDDCIYNYVITPNDCCCNNERILERYSLRSEFCMEITYDNETICYVWNDR